MKMLKVLGTLTLACVCVEQAAAQRGGGGRGGGRGGPPAPAPAPAGRGGGGGGAASPQCDEYDELEKLLESAGSSMAEEKSRISGMAAGQWGEQAKNYAQYAFQNGHGKAGTVGAMAGFGITDEAEILAYFEQTFGHTFDGAGAGGGARGVASGVFA